MKTNLRFQFVAICLFMVLLHVSKANGANPWLLPGIPVISTSPANVSVSILNCNDSVVVPVTIHNTGGSILNYSIAEELNFADDFENGLGKWVYDGAWVTVADAYSGNWALGQSAGSYVNNMNQSIEMKDSLVVMNPDSCILTYWLKYSMECCCDHFYTYIQVDGGAWIQLSALSCYSDWSLNSYDLSTYVSPGSYIKVRFTFTSDYSVTGTGMRLDDIRLGGTGTHVDWFTVPSYSGAVSPGDSTTVDFTAKSQGLNAGYYSTYIVINSNDPITPAYVIPVSMLVIGAPVMVIDTTTQNFGAIMEYTTSIGALQIKNSGCDTLTVDSLVSNSPVFSVPYGPLQVLPGDSVTVLVTFQPLSIGNFNGQVFVYQNGSVTAIPLTGVAFGAPSIAIQPDSLINNNTIYSCNDSLSLNLNVFNSGLTDLMVETGFGSIQGTSQLSYCSPQTYGYCCGMGIYNVQFNGIDNSSQDGSAGYEDFSAIVSTTVNPGETYAIYVQTGSSYSEKVRAWIDYNNDGFFSPDELVFSSDNLTDHYGFITIPTNARTLIPLRMRIGSEYIYNADPEPCTDVEYGQFEDYTIYITGNISFVPPFLTVSPGSFSALQVNLYSHGLVSGTYSGLINLTTNDPLNPLVTVPLQFTVAGSPAISLSDTLLTFPTIQMNTYTEDTFWVYNTGCDTLWVYDMYNQTGEFFSVMNSFYLPPSGSQQVIAFFAPLMPGSYSDTLFIDNNVQTTYVLLNGEALGASVVSTDPVSFDVTLSSCNDSVMYPLTIKNLGYDTLNYEIQHVSAFTENFENGLDKWTYDGSWTISSDAYSGSGALSQSSGTYYVNGMYQTIQMKDTAVVLQPDSCILRFMLKYDMECCCDGLSVNLQVNGGGWMTLYSYVCSDAWGLRTLDLSSYIIAGDYIRIQFLFHSDGSVVGTGIKLDDLSIGGTGSQHPWLSLNPSSGVVLQGDSAIVNLTFNSTNVAAGIHFDNIHIYTNDPLNPVVLLPCTFRVSGVPVINLSASQLAYPTIVQYTQSLDSFYIKNTGCDTLFVSNIVPTNAAFLVAITNEMVLPFDSAKILVTFNPQDPGPYAELLNIYSNLPDTFITLTGTATGAPGIVVIPDSLSLAITGCNDSTSASIGIYNSGTADLNWQVTSSSPGGTALSFNSYGQWATIGNVGAMPDQGTIEFWMWTNIWQNYNNCFSTSGWQGGNVGIRFEENYYGNFGVNIGDDNGSYNGFTIANPLPLNSWHHVAVTWDKTAGNLKTYFDGNLITDGNENLWASSFNNVMVGVGWADWRWWNGMMDELRIWNVARTQGEIMSTMNHTINGSNPNLIGYWKMDEGNGSTVHDATLHHNDGTFSGATWVNSSTVANGDVIVVTPDNGVTAPGSTTNLVAKAYSADFESGTYNPTLQVTSDDPLHPLVVVPVTLLIDGIPQIVVQDTCLQFGSLLQYTAETDSIVIGNTGCDTLFITGLQTSTAEFPVVTGPMVIPPNESEKVYINFLPVTIGNFYDTLKIYNNDVFKTVCLSGIATPIPFIQIDSTSFTDNFVCQETGSRELKIKNLGAVPLTYNIQVQNANWLEVDALVGNVLPGDSVIRTLTYWKYGLYAGVYDATIEITSNDPLNSVINVPFHFVVQDPYSPVNLGNDQNLCAGSEAVLDPNTGGIVSLMDLTADYSTYLWSDGSTGSTLTVTTSGTYFVHLWDNFGCYYADTVVVNFYDYPVVNAGNDTTACAGLDFNFNPVIQNLLPIAPTTAQIGNGVLYTSGVGPSPFGTYYMDDRTQMLYTVSELVSSGLSSGSIIKISFNVGAIGSPTMQGFTIRMGHVTGNVLNGFATGLTTVYTASSYTPSNGWNDFQLTNPFYWNGNQSIVVEVCFDNNSWSNTSSVQYTSVANTVWSGWCDNCAPGCSITGGSGFSERANIKLYGEGDVSLYTWTGPGGYLSHVRNPVIHHLGFGNAGLYILTVDNSFGCTGKDTIIVAVNPSPSVDAGVNQSIIYGTSTTLNGSAVSGIPPYTYTWSPAIALSDIHIPNPVANPLASLTYFLQVSGMNGCYNIDSVKITVLPIYQISGTISYNNTLNTPLNGLTIYLKNPAGIVIDTAITGINGDYVFTNLINGNYTYQISIGKPWAGVNATDALEVSKNVVFLTHLTGLNLLAADVNNSLTVTSADALLIMRRTVGSISSFAAGDWVFDNNAIPVANGNATRDIKGLCVGDVNASNIPAAKLEPMVNLEERGHLPVPADLVVDVPVRIVDGAQLGAVTLALDLSDNVAEILDVTCTSNGLVWNQPANRTLMIAWQNTDGLELKENGTILTVKLRLKSAVQAGPVFSIMAGSELADIDAKVLAPVNISVPHPGLDKGDRGLTLDVLPNPFSEATEVSWTVPEDGHVKLSLIDAYGRLIRVISDNEVVEGSYSYKYIDKELPPGIYVFLINFDGRDIRSSASVKVVKSH